MIEFNGCFITKPFAEWYIDNCTLVIDKERCGSVEIIDKNNDTAELAKLYVNPEDRGKGKGFGILIAAIEYCRIFLNKRFVRLWCEEKLVPFYEIMKFRKTGETYDNGDENVTYYVMKRELRKGNKIIDLLNNTDLVTKEILKNIGFKFTTNSQGEELEKYKDGNCSLSLRSWNNSGYSGWRVIIEGTEMKTNLELLIRNGKELLDTLIIFGFKLGDEKEIITHSFSFQLEFGFINIRDKEDNRLLQIITFPKTRQVTLKSNGDGRFIFTYLECGNKIITFPITTDRQFISALSLLDLV